ncbi:MULTISPECIES: ABC transporter permease [unclassified Archaeoglobus]|jgi:molybdate transport system permease protein|uniref:ABC transporter permease n=1 Tax=unclassified Archaeoglobus TaxID=2643606 RepID=UPI0025B930BE|nr:MULTISPECIES: ABC transporter permease subunit [unclassified Archaeoglobus]
MHQTLRLRFENFVFRAITTLSLFLLLFFATSIVLSIYIFTEPLAIVSSLLSPEIRFAVFLSVTTSTTSTLLALLVGLPAAYALSRLNIKGKNIIESILNIPIALPPVAIGAALLIFFTNTPSGIFINRILNVVYEVPGIIIAQFSVVTPYIIRLTKPVFDKIDPRYEKISRSFGYSSLETFFKVTIPLARVGILSATTLAWARAMGEFGATVTLAGATRYKTETLPIAVYLNLAQADIHKAMATILVLILVALVVFVVLQTTGGGEEL